MENDKLLKASDVKEYFKRVIFGADKKIDAWVDSIPAVDVVEVKHGEWEKRMNIGVLTWCSECGWMKHQEDERKYNYCQNCGAEMDGEDGDA